MSKASRISAAPAPRPLLSIAWRRWAAGIVILVAGIAAYHNSFQAAFQFDDILSVVENRTIRHLWPPWQALSPPVAGGAGVTGRPLTNFSLAVNYAIGGLDVRGYHVMNLALHLLVALTLWGVLRRTLQGGVLRRQVPGPDGPKAGWLQLGRRLSDELQRNAESLAFGATLLWTVHPLLTESIVCIVQRNEVLAGLFYLLTIYCFIRSVGLGDAENSRAAFPAAARGSALNWGGNKTVPRASVVKWQIFTVLGCLCGMASKEVVATVPLMVLLYDRTFVAGTFSGAWQRRKFLYVGLAGSWLLLGWLMLNTGQRAGTVGFGLGMSSWDYLLTQCRALTIYLKLSLWPSPLVADYGTTVTHSLVEVWWQGTIIVFLLLGTAVALWRRPLIGFLGAWFFVILAPSSSFVPLTTQTIAEHRMYLPLVPVMVLVTTALHLAWNRRGGWVCVVLALGAGWLTVQRNEDYRTEFILWTDTVAKQPNNERAHNNLGTELLAAGRAAEGIAHFEQVLRLKPDYAEAEHNLGLALGTVDRTPEAIPHFERAIQLKPKYHEAELSLALALMRLNRPTEALPHFERAVQIKSDYAKAEMYWGLALTVAGTFQQALPHFERAILLNPESPEIRTNYGNALLRAGRAAEALEQYSISLRLRPNQPETHMNLSLVLRQLGRLQEADAHHRAALELNPDLRRTENHSARPAPRP